jgi:hypothetical protein
MTPSKSPWEIRFLGNRVPANPDAIHLIGGEPEKVVATDPHGLCVLYNGSTLGRIQKADLVTEMRDGTIVQLLKLEIYGPQVSIVEMDRSLPEGEVQDQPAANDGTK